MGTNCKLDRTIVWAVLGILAVGALLSVYDIARCVVNPLPIDYGEGPALERARAVAAGQPLYPPMDRPPYVAWVYTPVYAWMCALGASWFDVGFLFGRVVSALSILVATGCVFALAREGNHDTRWATAGTLLFLGSFTVSAWGGLMRVDALGLALELAGLTVVARSLSQQHQRSGSQPGASTRAHTPRTRHAHDFRLSNALPILVAGLLFSSALLCKQSLLAGPLSACLWLHLSGMRRSARVLVLTCVTIVGSIVTWQMVDTRGWFWHHTITANQNDWSWAQFSGVARIAGRHAVLAYLVVLHVALRRRTETLTLQTLFLGSASLLSLMCGKAGSGINYFLELTAAASIASAAALPWFVGWLRRITGRERAAMLLPIVLATHVGCTARIPAPLDATAIRSLEATIDALRNAPGPVLADRPDLVTAAGKPIWCQPFEFTQLAEAGRWDQGQLLEAIRHAEFSVIALSFDPWDPIYRDACGTWHGGRFTDDMVAAIRSHYRVSERLGGPTSGTWLILRPAHDTVREGTALPTDYAHVPHTGD